MSQKSEYLLTFKYLPYQNVKIHYESLLAYWCDSVRNSLKKNKNKYIGFHFIR